MLVDARGQLMLRGGLALGLGVLVLAAGLIVGETPLGLLLVLGASALVGVALTISTRAARSRTCRNARGTAEVAWRATPLGYLSGRAWFVLPALVAYCSGLRTWQAAVALVAGGTLFAVALRRSSGRARTAHTDGLRWSDPALEEYRVRWEWAAAVLVGFTALSAMGVVAWRQPVPLLQYLRLAGITLTLATIAAYAVPFYGWLERGGTSHRVLMSCTWLSWLLMGASLFVFRATDSETLAFGASAVASATCAGFVAWCRRVGIRERVAELRGAGHGRALEEAYPALAR